MTWTGEPSGSGLYVFTDDGGPKVIPFGGNDRVLTMKSGFPSFEPSAISGVDIQFLQEISESGAPAGVFTVSSALQASTTSDTFVTIPEMTITPPSGSYFCQFNASIETNKSNVSLALAIFVDDTLLVESDRSQNVPANNSPVIFSTLGTVEVSGTNVISARWRRQSPASSPNWTIFGRTLSISKAEVN